mmetsp:Transcript_9800/g.25368  ORF Transcript_9800/g.25368 Transcript_9800/m.25368 type:complete len:224 (+) Transcript_9800:990-1661(+)
MGFQWCRRHRLRRSRGHLAPAQVRFQCHRGRKSGLDGRHGHRVRQDDQDERDAGHEAAPPERGQEQLRCSLPPGRFRRAAREDCDADVRPGRAREVGLRSRGAGCRFAEERRQDVASRKRHSLGCDGAVEARHLGGSWQLLGIQEFGELVRLAQRCHSGARPPELWPRLDIGCDGGRPVCLLTDGPGYPWHEPRSAEAGGRCRVDRGRTVLSGRAAAGCGHAP